MEITSQHSEQPQQHAADGGCSTSTSPWAAAFSAETMVLTRTEVNRALAIREAALAHDPLHGLSDFEYVQYAMCCPPEEAMEQVLKRMEMLRSFQQEYKIRDSPEDAVDIFHQLHQSQPGFFLSITHLPSSKNFMTVIDWAQLFPANLKTWEQDRAFFGYLYYTLQAKCCQFQAIREGSSILCECMDLSTRNFDAPFFARMQHELVRWYPKLQREVFLLNSPSIANVAFALWRRFMPNDQKEAIHLGHKIEGLDDRIDPFYKLPTPELAHQQVLHDMQLILQHRYRMEQQFRLPSEPLPENHLLYHSDPAFNLSA